jgi:two-component system sensor histidine kinase RpfC
LNQRPRQSESFDVSRERSNRIDDRDVIGRRPPVATVKASTSSPRYAGVQIVGGKGPSSRDSADPKEGRFYFNPDERNQSLVRLGIVSAVVIYSGFYGWVIYSEIPIRQAYFLFALCYLAWSWVLYAWANLLFQRKASDEARNIHRGVCIVSDIGGLSYGMYLGDIVGAPLFPVYLWVTLGNGIRFGNKHLYFSAAMSAICFVAVAYASESWEFESNVATVFGLAIGLLIVPLYVGGLLTTQRETLKALEEANRVKTDFIATINHELRTPLNGVIAVADLLTEQELSAKHRSMVQMIRTSANSQLALVNRILDVSKLSAGEMQRVEESFDLLEILRNAYDIIHPQIQNRKLRFRVFVEPDVETNLHGSAEHLSQILLNLCSNAVKFTSEGFVDLRVGMSARSGNVATIRFEVEDTGVGIPASKLSKVFTPFAQADGSVSRRFGGTGLGLAISAQLIELLGGSLYVDSEEAKGTAFLVELPFQVRAVPASSMPLDNVRIQLIGFGRDTSGIQRVFAAAGAAIVADAPPKLLGSSAGRIDASVVVGFIDADAFGSEAELVDHLAANGIVPSALVLIGDNSALEPLAVSRLEDLGDVALVHRAIRIAKWLGEDHAPAVKRPEVYKRPLRILVAEDNETNQTVMRMALEGSGHQVTVVPNGMDALDALDGSTFDLAMFDMHMPGMSGIEATQIYHFSNPAERVPIVLVTADTSQTARELAADAGVAHFIVKPIRIADLLTTIYEIMDRKEGERERREVGKQAGFSERMFRPPLRSVADEPAIDRETLSELDKLSPDKAFLANLIAGFLADAENHCIDIERNMREGKFESMRDAAHALKGAARSVGASAVATRVSAIHGADPLRLGADGSRLVTLLREDLSHTRNAFQRFFEETERSQIVS